MTAKPGLRLCIWFRRSPPTSAWCSARRLARRPGGLRGEVERDHCHPGAARAAGGRLKGALVSIDAVACNPDIAQAVVDGGAEYLLAVKANQPTLHDEVVAFFDTAQAEDVEAVVEVDKDHGRIETRRCVVSRQIAWLTGKRRFPGEVRFPRLAAIAVIDAGVELRGRCTFDRRFYIISAPLSAARCAAAVRGHWREAQGLPARKSPA